MEDIRKKYAQVNKRIKDNIERKQVDISNVMEMYAHGISEDKIRNVYRLTEEELGYILRNNMTARIRNKRNENIGSLRGKAVNLMGLSKKQQKEDNEVLSIEEALALFE